MSPPLSAGLPLIVLPESPSPSSSLSLPTPFLAYHQFHHIIPSSNNAPLGEFSHPLPQPSRPLSHSLILFSPLSVSLALFPSLHPEKRATRFLRRASERAKGLEGETRTSYSKSRSSPSLRRRKRVNYSVIRAGHPSPPLPPERQAGERGRERGLGSTGRAKSCAVNPFSLSLHTLKPFPSRLARLPIRDGDLFSGI